MRRRSFLTSSAALALLPIELGCLPPAIMPSPKAIAKEVRNEFLHAWQGYKFAAWGYDEVRPLSGKPTNFFLKNHSFGLSIIEAMDTLYVMVWTPSSSRALRGCARTWISMSTATCRCSRL